MTYHPDHDAGETHGADPSLSWEFTVPNQHGLHLRALQLLVSITNRYACEVEARNVSMDGQWINAKSIMGLTLLQGAFGYRVGLRLQGEGAHQALAELQDLVARKFDED